MEMSKLQSGGKEMTITSKQFIIFLIVNVFLFVNVIYAFVNLEKELEEANRKLITTELRLANSRYEERMCKQRGLYNNFMTDSSTTKF